MAIQALCAGSAPGDNGLAATLLKKGGPGATTLIHTAITAAWRSGEAPAEWKDACMHAIYKGRGSRTSMDAYRGITVLNIDAKVYVMLLLRRLRVDMEDRLHDAQHGFRSGRGTADCLFNLRRVVELARAHATPMHAAFVDFSKAFDSVNHEALWEVLEARGIHPKLISLIKDLYKDNRVRVAGQGVQSEWFCIRTGVRQGCPLSPLLFNIFMDFLARQVIQACEAKGVHGFKVAFRISGQVVNSPSEELLSMLMLLYADDLVLLAPSRSDLTTALEELERITRKWGMVVNYPKTEAVVFGMPAATAAAATIQVGSNSVAVKPQFKYVGSIVQADGGQDRELQRRLCSAGQVFRSLKANLFSSKRVGLGAKLKFYKSLVLPRLLYGAAESWALTEAQGAQLETFHNGCLRQMMGLHRGPDGPSTAELLARTGQANMADHMRRHRVRWLGHAARKPNDVMVKQLLFAHSIPGHPRPLGRPHLTWMDTAMHDMGSLGRMLQIDLPRDWASLALHRDVWRGVVSRC